MADAAEGNGARHTTAPSAQLRETPAPMAPGTSDALGLVAGTVPATPLKYSVSQQAHAGPAGAVRGAGAARGPVR